MVQTFVNIHRVVHHIRLRQKLYLGFQDLVVSVQLLVLQKLKKREHEMPVEVWRYLCCQIILRHRSTKQKKEEERKTVSHKQQKSVYNRPDLLQPLASFRIKRRPRERHMHAHENSQERKTRKEGTGEEGPDSSHPSTNPNPNPSGDPIVSISHYSKEFQ